MTSGRARLIGIIGGLLCAIPMGLAGPGTGTTYTNYTLIIDPDANDRVQINLPVAEYEEDAPVRHETRSPSVFVFQDYLMNQNTNTGWHIHHGIVLVTIADGSVEWYDAQCILHIRHAGDFFTESDQLHYVRNASADPARLILTFIIAKGETNKIFMPAPPCAAALHLNAPRVPSLK